jgi:hypothetical protein
VRSRALAGAIAVGVVCGAGACGPGKGRAPEASDRPGVGPAATADTQSPSAASVDSVVLERSMCFGSCPAYRLSVAASGRVHFASLNPGEAGRTASDTIARGRAVELLARAERVGLFQLPDRTADDSMLCSARATDHSTVVVTVFGGAGTKRVEDYTGCYVSVDPPRIAERLLQLRSFQAEIDSVAGSGRWVRAARRD